MIRQRGGDWSLARVLLESYGLSVEPAKADDAVRAAFLWEPGSPLSLDDCLRLAQGERLAATIWTADPAWGSSALVRQVR